MLLVSGAGRSSPTAVARLWEGVAAPSQAERLPSVSAVALLGRRDRWMLSRSRARPRDAWLFTEPTEQPSAATLATFPLRHSRLRSVDGARGAPFPFGVLNAHGVPRG